MANTAARFSVDLVVTEKGRRAPRWDINSDLNGELTLADLLAFTKESLILIADEALRDEQSRGFDPKPVVAVDGRIGKPIIQVNPLGKIEFFARANITEMIRTIYDAIEYRSPVLTGQYKRSNYVFLNGKQVANDKTTLEAWLSTNPIPKPNDVLRFLNITPYARKLERLGITRQKSKHRTKKSSDEKGRSGFNVRILAPNGTYYLVSRSANRLFGKNVKIKFKFVPGSELGLTATFKTSRGVPAKKGRKTSKPPKVPRTYLYPSIQIKFQEGGTL